MKTLTAKILLSTTMLILCSGIIRHDTGEGPYLKMASLSPFDCVGQIINKQEEPASCVLIAPKFVLTAAHMLITSETRPEEIEMQGRKIIAYVPYNEHPVEARNLVVIVHGQKRKVTRFLIHPNYFDSLTSGSCDIALIELDAAVTGAALPVINGNRDEVGHKVYGVGYGVTGIANQPDLVKPAGKKIAGQNTVDSLGGTKYNGEPELLVCDFDHPTRKDCNKCGSAVPQPLEYICSGGDSGGGLFRSVEKKWELIDICAGVNYNLDQLEKTGYYGQIMAWTRLSLFKFWVEQQINKAKK